MLKVDAVKNKDRMDVDSVLQLSNPKVLENMNGDSFVTTTVVPDRFRINESNKVGLYPHPVAVALSWNVGKLLVLDYDPIS